MGRPATERQANFLANHGLNPDNFDFEAASAKIDEIKGSQGGGGQRGRNGNNSYQPRGNGGNNNYRRNSNNNGNGRGYGNNHRNANGNGRSYGGGNRNYGNRNGSGAPRGNGQRDPNGPASPKQRAILEEYGYDPNISKAQASDIIAALKDNNWEPLDYDYQTPGPACVNQDSGGDELWQ